MPPVPDRPDPAVPAAAPPDDALRPSSRVSRRARWIALIGVAVVLLAVGGVALTTDRGPAALTRRDVEQTVQQRVTAALDERDQQPPDAVAVYQAVLPSLVVVRSQGASSNSAEVGTGAGVVVNRDGSVLTALHVVEGATTIRVTFTDGTETTATIASSQPDNDTAVLTPQQLPEVVVPAVLGGGLTVGDDVFAVGHPLGLTRTLTAGVVSALDRNIEVEAGRTLRGLIQFDASVNPGNSGGPLLNRGGQVVGIVTALANPAKQPSSAGLSFAVPIRAAGGADAPPQ